MCLAFGIINIEIQQKVLFLQYIYGVSNGIIAKTVYETLGKREWRYV